MKRTSRLRYSRLAAADRRHIWHPFTQMRDWEREPFLVIERARGNHLYDVNGKRYLDGVSSLWVTVHGHRHPRIDAAVRNQLARVAHTTFLGLTHPPAIELARRLMRIAPRGLSRVFYSDNGSTAVEVALKMAFQHWRQRGEKHRTRFLSFRNSYHGDTIGSVSVGGIGLFHGVFRPLLFDALFAESPYCYRCPAKKSYPACGIECLGSAESLMRKRRREIAAVVVEPLVQAAAGMLVYPSEFLRGLRDLCTKHGILLIADEVATGFGRTGAMFACEKAGVSPDLMALAKGITGGYLPLAATLATEEVYESFKGRHEEFRTFFHGHTYTANPLACASAVASLDVFEEEKTIERLQPKIARLRKRLARLREIAIVGDIRQEGMMVGIELVKNRRTKTPHPPKERIGHRVILDARKRGVILRPLGNVIVLMPPLSITPREIDRLVDVTIESIAAVSRRNISSSAISNAN
ncbi:MAG: adenosylmethionine--8-amino-7-oxononanoate transaminase [Nitrospirota bacterium]